MDKNTLSDKLAKILRLADRAGTPAEAEAAAAMAAKLAEQYGIDLLEIRDTENDPLDGLIGEELGQVAGTWRRTLLAGIGRRFGVVLFHRKERKSSHSRVIELYGRPELIEATKQMYEHFVTLCDRLTLERCVGMGKAYSMSWRYGFITGILKAMKGENRSIIVLSKEAEALRESVHPDGKTIKSRPRITDADGFDAGRQAGEANYRPVLS